MKALVSRVAIALVICALTSVLAFAKSKKESVTFPYDLSVNGTLVKKGNYDIRFDEATKELSVLKAGKVVARATARVETEANKSKALKFSTIGSENERQLLSVTFSGSDQKLVVSGGEAASNE